MSKKQASPPRRAVIVGGVRTPFVKAFQELLKLDTIGLGKIAVSALIEKYHLDRAKLEGVVWGGVIFPGGAPNVGREIALDLGLHHVEAMTCSRACASSLQAVTIAAAMIERGDADIVIAGGSDSTSNAEIKLPQKVVHALAPVTMGGKSGAMDYFQALAQLAPFTDILPQAPAVAERSTGEKMGEACERMATRNEISREDQDAFAVRSHHRAAAAVAADRFLDEITPVTLPGGKKVFADTMIRADTSVDKIAKLRPVFARKGTLTAANSSPLTDGAAAVLMMSEEAARALGYTPKAALRSWAYVGVDPADQLLMGPALAMPKALARAGMSLKDADLVDMHEAFAAQVLSVVKMLGSAAFAKARLGQDQAVGEIDMDRFNVHGGSIAIGHPFGATGARMITTMANELHLTGKQTALLGICAAGGLGGAAVLEAI
ncbi:acetyl-CoA C-acyltransferase [Myxococcota bacterium]|nr:acetyl-CoA C-acyltransferase [Myxococcota bacterium]MBU1432183.1 acetyl-CoA C-acyltransferase [Myxococcota bacterium]MBU1897866.1 acetyl-CoA C-acyltransferase [Myxococcota bacterium]